MRKIYLMPPLIQGQRVHFQWRVEPQSDLYRKTSFILTFPDSVDPARVPKRLWWDIFLLCLHPHWLLLQPCEIHLPLQLGKPLRQFWLQLLRNGLDTLDAYASRRRSGDMSISIVDGELDVPYERVAGSGYGTAFSGGKDSLLQAALLLELTDRPLLVATTSPMPPLSDHVSARRGQLFEQIKQRRNPVFAEVATDFRSSWDSSFAPRHGYRVAVNELTDTFLYTANLIAVGAALGYTHLFVASEAELQESAVIDGTIVQHSHFMYTAATQRAIARLFASYGLHFGSLIWPLPTMQIQQLLWSRYPDLADLQYSCWRVAANEATCSQCEQCLRVAVTALERGHDPQRMGIDLLKVVKFASRWKLPAKRRFSQRLPQDDAADLLGTRVASAIRRTSLVRLGKVLLQAPGKLPRKEILATLRRFRRLQRRVANLPVPPPMAVREAFIEWLDSDLRSGLMSIYTHHFALEPSDQHLGHFERSRTLTQRVTSCLD